MKNLLLIIAILSFAACSNIDVVDDNLFVNDQDASSVISDDNYVSKEKASDVANLFFSSQLAENNQSRTRVENPKKIKLIETLFDKESKMPSMYIVNYDGGGFVIVSATKTYYPILAYSDNGSMYARDVFNVSSGLMIWVDETQFAIKESEKLSGEALSKVESLWNAYTPNTEISTRASNGYTYEQYMRFYQRMSELYKLCPGYSFGPLSSASSFLSAAEYNNLVSIATFYGSPLECTIVGYKSLGTVVGPLIGTLWHQNTGFNDLCPNKYPAGCVAIAMAQIMKYYMVPQYYSWSNMTNDERGTLAAQELIRDIGVAVHMKYTPTVSTAYLDDAVATFSSMGYNVAKKDYNFNEVRNSVMKRNPIYMKGVASGDIGHAWVCEGLKESSSERSYFIEYLLVDNSYSSVGGPSWQSPTTSSGFVTYYLYLNWGWGPNYGNGWFLSDNVNSVNGNFTKNRKNLYVNPR